MKSKGKRMMFDNGIGACLLFLISILPIRAVAVHAGAMITEHPRHGVVLDGDVRVWNATPLEPIRLAEEESIFRLPPQPVGAGQIVPSEPLRPIRLVAARNAAASGQIVVASPGGITGLEAELGDFVAADADAVIDADAAVVRYAVRRSRTAKELGIPEGGEDVHERRGPASGFGFPRLGTHYWGSVRGESWNTAEAPYFDVLEEAPHDGEPVQPVWVTVTVPADATPGLYSAELTIRAGDAARTTVPVSLSVSDWVMPDPGDFHTHVGIIQSPETIAHAYGGVELWSDEHFALIEPSLELIGRAGNRTLQIPLTPLGRVGNQESMVRWVRADDGFKPDFSVVDRYLELYRRHHGPPNLVEICAWDARQFDVSASSPDFPESIWFTELDPETGETTLNREDGPFYGFPGSHEFWRPAIDGILERVEAIEGWSADAVMLGLTGDSIPSPLVVNFFSEIAPGMRWTNHGHGRIGSTPSECGTYRTAGPVDMEIGMWTILWDNSLSNNEGLNLGWNIPFFGTTLPRGYVVTYAPPYHYRLLPEVTTVRHDNSRSRGFDRLGADYWLALETDQGGRMMMIYYSGGGGWRNVPPPTRILGIGPDGAIATVRYEMLREGIQASEARIFIEQALEDAEKRARLGETLIERCHEQLKAFQESYLEGRRNINHMGRSYRDRHRMVRAEYAVGDWKDRTAGLFDLAAEVAGALESN